MTYEFRKSDPFYNQCHYRIVDTVDWYIINRDTSKSIVKDCPYTLYLCDNTKEVFLLTKGLFQWEEITYFKGV